MSRSDFMSLIAAATTIQPPVPVPGWEWSRVGYNGEDGSLGASRTLLIPHRKELSFSSHADRRASTHSAFVATCTMRPFLRPLRRLNRRFATLWQPSQSLKLTGLNRRRVAGTVVPPQT